MQLTHIFGVFKAHASQYKRDNANGACLRVQKRSCSQLRYYEAVITEEANVG